MKKKHYSEEFKQMILEKLRVGVPVAQLAREYELPMQTLNQWNRAVLDANVTNTDAQEENRRLKKKIRQLEEDIEILQKAATWFKKTN